MCNERQPVRCRSHAGVGYAPCSDERCAHGQASDENEESATKGLQGL